MTPEDWSRRYTDLATRLRLDAAGSGPFLLGFSACVDWVWRVGPDAAASLGAAVRRTAAPAAAREVVAETMSRIIEGHGGELVTDWPQGAAWFRELLGTPYRRQIGGTGPQAAWTLAELGADCVVPLLDRSAEQLAVLHPEIRVAHDGDLVRVADLRGTPAVAQPLKPAHCVLEFTAGARLGDALVPRSTRVILRFVDDGIECDAELDEIAPRLLPHVRGAVVSGMNGIRPGDTSSLAWLEHTLDTWRDAGLSDVHLELADYPTVESLTGTASFGRGRARSLGLSLSELRRLRPADEPPGTGARALAETYGYDLVVVHADEWSLAAHRQDPETVEQRLMTGNLLATARAAHGAPQPAPRLPADARLGSCPDDGPADAGWRVTCAPAPYLRSPRSTIGLGDTFVAGFLLGAHLGDRTEVLA